MAKTDLQNDYDPEACYGNVFRLKFNSIQKLSSEQKMIRYTTIFKCREAFQKIENEYKSCSMNLMKNINDVLDSIIESEINPSKIVSTPSSIKNQKRKFTTPSLSIQKYSKQKKNKILEITEQENDQNLLNQVNQQQQQSLIATKCSIEESKSNIFNNNNNNNNNSIICTRARTRAQKKLEQQQKQMKSNYKESSSLSSSSTLKNNKLINKTEIVSTTPSKRQAKHPKQQDSNKKVYSSTKCSKMNQTPVNHKKLHQNSTVKNDRILKLATPVSKKQIEEKIILSAEKLKKAADYRKKYLEERQEQLRTRSVENKNRVLANKKKKEEITSQMKNSQEKSIAKRRLALETITGINKNDNKTAIKITPMKLLHDMKNNNNNNIDDNTVNPECTALRNNTTTTTKQQLNKQETLNKICKLYNMNNNNNNNNDNDGKIQINHKTNDAIDEYIILSPIKTDNDDDDKNSNLNDNNLVNITGIIESTDLNMTEVSMIKKPINKTIIKLKEEDKKISPLKITNNNKEHLMKPDETITTYEISTYVDSEDDDYFQEQISYPKKKIPKWATDSSLLYQYLEKLHCNKNKLNFNQEMADKIFTNFNPIVNLNAMGLEVIPKYRDRTSSVIWSS